jgi:hypothetical protein
MAWQLEVVNRARRDQTRLHLIAEALDIACSANNQSIECHASLSRVLGVVRLPGTLGDQNQGLLADSRYLGLGQPSADELGIGGLSVIGHVDAALLNSCRDTQPNAMLDDKEHQQRHG